MDEATCPCKIGRGWNWHNLRGLSLCEMAKEKKRNADRVRPPSTRTIRQWRPGTSIYVPEIDPL